MPAKIDRLNRRYGRLVVREMIQDSPYPEMGIWRCACDCGNEIDKAGRLLYSAKSCGCLGKQSSQKRGVDTRRGASVTLNAQYRSHKQGAKERGCAPLDRLDWDKLTSSPCHYCGKIDVRKFIGRLNKNDTSFRETEVNGIDRVDPSLGYTVENCVSCCECCNFMKLDMSSQDFSAHLQSIYNHLNLSTL